MERGDVVFHILVLCASAPGSGRISQQEHQHQCIAWHCGLVLAGLRDGCDA